MPERVLTKFLVFLFFCLFVQPFRLINENDSPSSTDQTCNGTHYTFRSGQYYQNSTLLNRTFSKINNQIKRLEDVTWKANDTATYSIFNLRPTFLVLDSEQKASSQYYQFYLENLYVLVNIEFDWWKHEKNASGELNKTGKGSANGKSEPIDIVFRITASNQGAKQSLYAALPYNQAQLTLLNLDGIGVTVQQKMDIIKVLNWRDNTSVCQSLTQSVQKIIEKSLNQSFDENNQLTRQHVNYTWISDSTGSHTINITRVPFYYYPQKDYLLYAFETYIDGYQNRKCAPYLPTQPQDILKLGAQQEVAFVFYENLINYAIEKGILDGKMNHDIWPTTRFTYTAQDLYSIINGTRKFSYTSEVTGYCRGQTQNTKISNPFNPRLAELNVVLGYNCLFYIENKNILNLNVLLDLDLGVHDDNVYLNVPRSSLTYENIPGYEVMNLQGLYSITLENIQLLYNGPIFGSGFPQYFLRNDRKFTAIDNKYVFIY